MLAKSSLHKGNGEELSTELMSRTPSPRFSLFLDNEVQLRESHSVTICVHFQTRVI